MTARVHGVIVTHHRPQGLRSVVRSLGRQTRVPDVLVLVDNEGSPDVDLVADEHRESGHDVVVLRPGENTGPAGGTALAMEWVLDNDASDDDWVIRLDDDTPPPRDDLIEELVDFGTKRRHEDAAVAGVGVVGSRFDYDRGRSVRIDNAELDGPVDVDWLATNCFPAFSCAAIRSHGTLDADLFYGSSEVEYGLRLRRAGQRLVAHGELWRSMGRATADTAGPQLWVGDWNWRRYYSLRNQIHLLRRAGRSDTALRVALIRGIAKPAVSLVRHPRSAWTHLRWNARAALDGWRGQLGRTIDPVDFGVAVASAPAGDAASLQEGC